MKLTVKEALEMWNDNSLGYKSHEEQLKSNLLWMDYWNRLASEFKDFNSMPKGKYPVLYEMIKKNINFEEINTVLDIGAGMGDYSLFFAEDNKSVHAIDMSLEPLEVLNKRAKIFNYDSLITSEVLLWENFKSDKKYDLVFSSMCPGVCDPDSILKMDELATKTCVLILTGKKGSSSIRRELINKIIKERPVGLLSDAIYPFNYLYALGKNPSMLTKSFVSKTCKTVEEAVDDYIEYFKIWDFKEDFTRPIIEAVVKENSVDGYLTDEITINNAIIIWNK